MGEPNFNPEGLASRSHAEYVEGEPLLDMIREDLVAERIAIDSYREMIQYIGDKDTTTPRAWWKSSPWKRSAPTTWSACWRT